MARTTMGTTTMTTIRDTTATTSISHHLEEATVAAEEAEQQEQEQEAPLVEATFMRTKSEWWPVNRARMSSSWASTMTSQKPTSVLTCSSLCTRILNPARSPGSFPLLTAAGVSDQSRLSARDCHYHPREINRHLPITCSCCWPFALTTRSFSFVFTFAGRFWTLGDGDFLCPLQAHPRALVSPSSRQWSTREHLWTPCFHSSRYLRQPRMVLLPPKHTTKPSRLALHIMADVSRLTIHRARTRVTRASLDVQHTRMTGLAILGILSPQSYCSEVWIRSQARRRYVRQ